MKPKYDPGVNYWQALGVGLRGSTFLRVGAVGVVLTAVCNVAAKLAGKAEIIDLNNWVFLVPWITWILTLLLLSLGFMITGARPYLTRMGWVTGTFHLGQSLDLFTIIFAAPGMGFPPAGMALARYITLIFFAYAEQQTIGLRMRHLLTAAAGLESVKIVIRTLIGLPTRASFFLDMGLLILLAVAYWQLAAIVAREENHWARRRITERSASFEDFNNPEHDWD